MRIVLEENDWKFVTTIDQTIGKIRWLMVKVGGKIFNVRREYDRYSGFFGDDSAFHEEIDRLLVKEMEYMLTKALSQAAASIPDGPIEISAQR